MTTTIIWQKKDQADYSIEYFRCRGTSEYGINTMKGTVILLLDQVPTLVNYEIVSDKDWKARSIKISQQMPDNKNMNIDLRVSQDQNWREYDTYTSSHHSTIIDSECRRRIRICISIILLMNRYRDLYGQFLLITRQNHFFISCSAK